MTDDPKPPQAAEVWCRRLEKRLPLDEHSRCPYCYGTDAQIAGGKHEHFCDFKPGRDPLQFGFPPDSSRNLEA